jgi:Uma2 family endonuclease
MTLAPSEVKTYSSEEYFAFEIQSEIRHEYRNGEIVPMTGGTPNHNELVGNLIVILKLALKNTIYSVFVTDQRLWIPEKNIHTYPDMMIIPRPIQLQSGRNDTVINPILIAEVLSKSTKDYDRDEKFSAYRTIPTFQEYLLIDQYRPRVEQFIKQDSDRWLYTEYKGQEAKVSLASIPVEISLADLYENIEF